MSEMFVELKLLEHMDCHSELIRMGNIALLLFFLAPQLMHSEVYNFSGVSPYTTSFSIAVCAMTTPLTHLSKRE